MLIVYKKKGVKAVTGKRAFRLILALLFTLLLALSFSACSTAGEVAAQLVEETSAPPEPTPRELKLGSLSISPDAESLSLEGTGATLEDLMSLSGELDKLREISLGVTEARLDQIRAVEAAFPQAEVNWKVLTPCGEVDGRAESLDLTAAEDADVEEIISACALLPELKTVVLAPEDGVTTLSFESLSALAEALPGAELNCRFELFGQTADWTTEKLKYCKTDIGNGGVDKFRAALPYLRSLTLLRFENCGIDDNDKMAQLRSDFPDAKVVWSINIGGYTFMTDTTLINDGDTNLLRDYNVDVLRYMPDVLYLDIGHNHHLSNIEFVRNWPKLQVVILTLSEIRDITPLEDCPDMEYLEMVSTGIESIDAVAGMDKLEYLNLGCMWNLSDLSPVFGLKNLKIVRICGSTFNGRITQASVAELKEALPESTFVSDYGGDPTKSGLWRYNNDGSLTERYALLREQMLYDLNWQLRLSNSPSGEED